MDIYVGNFHFNASEDELRGIFEPFGTVSNVVIIKDRETGRSRGFGFVTIDEEEKGHVAIQELNGTEFMGRKLVVNTARPRSFAPRGGGEGGAPRFGGGPRRGGGGHHERGNDGGFGAKGYRDREPRRARSDFDE